MKPRDALNILDQVGANLQGNRQDHFNIQQAIMTLRAFIEQHDPLLLKDKEVNAQEKENQEKNDTLPENTTDDKSAA